MKEIVVRLHKGDLLKESIKDICIKNNIKAGVVVSSVGSLDKAVIRNAGATIVKEFNEPLEIISLNGTVSRDRIHLHISVANKNYETFGGHLMDGSIVNTTVELVILELDSYEFQKDYSKICHTGH